MLDALIQEIKIKKNRHPHLNTIRTVYFGGGTPSILPMDDLWRILDVLHHQFDLSKTIEITLEANPDDLSKSYLSNLISTPINRLSIGTQSFEDPALKWMKRVHNAENSLRSIQDAQDVGFTNINIDLIYGIPSQEDLIWQKQLQIAHDLNIQHLSCYALTVEPKTLLEHQIKMGKIKPLDETQAANQFKILMDFAEQAGWIHYEISNLCKPGYQSNHNTSYWKGDHYIGIGPSAHSFDGQYRYWNISNNAKYIQSLLDHNTLPEDSELQSEINAYHEWLLTGLRTIWGIDLNKLNHFSKDISQYFWNMVESKLKNGSLELRSNTIRIPKKYWFSSDGIIADLFLDY